MKSKISEFTDERIINSIKQSYNFSDEVIMEYAEVILKRGLLDKDELKIILEENKIKQAKYKLDRDTKIIDEIKSKKKFGNFFKDPFLVLSLLALVVGVIIYFKTGSIYFMMFGAGAGGVATLRSRNSKFRR